MTAEETVCTVNPSSRNRDVTIEVNLKVTRSECQESHLNLVPELNQRKLAIQGNRAPRTLKHRPNYSSRANEQRKPFIRRTLSQVKPSSRARVAPPHGRTLKKRQRPRRRYNNSPQLTGLSTNTPFGTYPWADVHQFTSNRTNTFGTTLNALTSLRPETADRH